MHPGALRALEFDRIVQAVCGFAQTPMGAAVWRRLRPLTAAGAVAGTLAATAETVRFLADNQIALQAPSDFEEVLDRADRRGTPARTAQLLSLASFLASVDATAAAVRRARSAFPILRTIADTVVSFESESDRRPPQDRSGRRRR